MDFSRPNALLKDGSRERLDSKHAFHSVNACSLEVAFIFARWSAESRWNQPPSFLTIERSP